MQKLPREDWTLYWWWPMLLGAVSILLLSWVLIGARNEQGTTRATATPNLDQYFPTLSPAQATFEATEYQSCPTPTPAPGNPTPSLVDLYVY